MTTYLYQCDVCLELVISDKQSQNIGLCNSDDGGLLHFVGREGVDAALRNLVLAAENILTGADMGLDENKYLQSAVTYAKLVLG